MTPARIARILGALFAVGAVAAGTAELVHLWLVEHVQIGSAD